uniref:DHFR domain-containing protein n=1 Tax=Nelumbo nucifera TaxID=4432 RepID=A0A822Z0V9_NELNU|nr:TPA_asm: hypothetical protein HUJ06_007746 [Nelumbo nucifera]
MAGDTITSLSKRTYQVVVSATRSMGIGKDGKLPWSLSSDVKFFHEITTFTSDPDKRNAVIMSRNSWEALALDQWNCPLPGRLNLVLTRSVSSSIGTSKDVVVCGSMDSALELLATSPYCLSIEKVFVAGGDEILREALSAPGCNAIHITEIETNIECDTFMPPIDPTVFRPWYSSFPLVENNIKYSFVTYVRMRSSAMEALALNNGTTFDSSSPDNLKFGEKFSFLPEMIINRHEEYMYLKLVQDIISNGNHKDDKTGILTLSKFGCQMRFNLRKSFPLLTTQKVFWGDVSEELFRFINGSRNAKLVDVIEKVKNKPDDGRIVLSAWSPSDLKLMGLPPCQTFAQFYVANGELSCQMYQHSADMTLGVPLTIASYAALTCMVAHVCGLAPGDFFHVIGDARVCKFHISPLQEQLKRLPRHFPILKINPEKKDIGSFVVTDFKLMDYDPHQKIEMEMAV